MFFQRLNDDSKVVGSYIVFDYVMFRDEQICYIIFWGVFYFFSRPSRRAPIFFAGGCIRSLPPYLPIETTYLVNNIDH